jgi:threonine synthase
MRYVSTRGASESLSPSAAILKGVASDGGLLVPEKIPRAIPEILPYKELANKILKLYFDDFDDMEIEDCVRKAYGAAKKNFSSAPDIAPLKKIGGYFFLELFNGPTLAFKDVALTLAPELMKKAKAKQNVKNKFLILVATSGDTGSAALEGFKNIEGFEIVVFYPYNGVSAAQEAQMTTVEGTNTRAVAVRGNFDDAQAGVKKIFADPELNKKAAEANVTFSSANSINIARLFPQTVYYFYAYSRLVETGEIKFGEKINFTVPTGNFGNILAGFYAKSMGLPIDKLICASNENKILYDFFNTGIYDTNREFIKTISPSMDILVSSNFERMIYLAAGAETTKRLFDDLKETGVFKYKLRSEDFLSSFATQAEIKSALSEFYGETGYIMDPHTAAAYKAAKDYKSNNSKNVIIATASPHKFSETISETLGIKFDAGPLEKLKTKKITQTVVCDVDDMPKIIEEIL